MSFFENTRKPVGFAGKIMVAMMNVGHSAVARWGLQFLELAPDAKVLDCGCGGGANIKRLLKKCPQGVVKGIDYSPVSVEKSKKVNEAAIAEGRCAVLQGSVADMMFADTVFDAVTAFETVYFWPDLPRCFREVYRVLKDDGVLIAPTFTHGNSTLRGRIKLFFMKLAGFPLNSRWSSADYLAFLRQNGWTVRKSAVLKASFPLTYAECVKPAV